MRSSTPKSATRPHAIALLEADHESLRTLLDRLASARSPASRAAMLQRVHDELVTHVEIEEEIFYPAYLAAVRSMADRGLYFEAAEEHHLIAIVLDELATSPPEDEAFVAKAKVLRELVQHHAEEEEEEMFPSARKVLDKDALVVLGGRMLARKQELRAEATRGGARARSGRS